MASARWSKEGFKRPQEGPKRLQENSKVPPGGPRGAKRGPRRVQDSPKTAPNTVQSPLQIAAFYSLIFKTFQRGPQDLPQPSSKEPPAASGGPKRPPGGAQEAPRGTQEGPRATKRLPDFSSGVLGFSPERSWALALRSRASVLI